ncbi:uncharacterized protein BX664DRAFT_341388 [Halteromyces radiatus]|uniref:uncharacterized protein n=1 Tax=Halteromyces radiatus TaxID=101107 RepID=UPI0022205FD7|nr:uncharacterized protein BX664DRAFT_341388 [Halteromyces radiatus]KAI8079756.1 hypothetical protein BX664DRAFT_341388 [Halteromyces radiatus]
MYRTVLFLSLCLCVLGVPIDKKQSLGVDDQITQGKSDLLAYEPRQNTKRETALDGLVAAAGTLTGAAGGGLLPGEFVNNGIAAAEGASGQTAGTPPGPAAGTLP